MSEKVVCWVYLMKVHIVLILHGEIVLTGFKL